MTPNFFLVGTTKGGTSSLDLWLRDHPDVATPKRKEMHFFCSCPNPKLRVADTLEEYLRAFPEGRAVGESSPCYLYYPEVAKRLDEFPGTRVIISLRDPAERFWSHHLMNSIYRPSGLDAMDIVERNLAEGRTNALEDLFGMGLYGEQVDRYIDVFGHQRTLVMFLEETTADPDLAVGEVVEFLGLSPYHTDTTRREKQYVEPRGPLSTLLLRNPRARSIGNRLIPKGLRRFLKTSVLGDPAAKPMMPESLRLRLHELYTEDSRYLEGLLGRQLPWAWHR